MKEADKFSHLNSEHNHVLITKQLFEPVNNMEPVKWTCRQLILKKWDRKLRIVKI